MNGKQAKRLRRAAESATTGSQKYAFTDTWHHKFFSVLGSDGKMTGKALNVYTRRLADYCTRAVYQRMKGAALHRVLEKLDHQLDAAMKAEAANG